MEARGEPWFSRQSRHTPARPSTRPALSQSGDALARWALRVPFRFQQQVHCASSRSLSSMAGYGCRPRPDARDPLPVLFLLIFDDIHLTPKNRDRHAAFADALLDQAQMAS